MAYTASTEQSTVLPEDAGVVWAQCLELIRESVTYQAFKTWFEPTRPIKLEGTTLTIQVPSQFFYEWIEEHYYALVRKTIVQILGERASAIFHGSLKEKPSGFSVRVALPANLS